MRVKCPTNTALPPGTTGAIVELLVAADLMSQGWHVFRALSPSCFCDLIAVKGDRTRYIEVRTGQQTKTKGIAYPKKRKPGTTEFAVVLRGHNKVHYFDVSSVCDKSDKVA